MASATDDFNRADDATGLGANWTLMGAPAVFNVVDLQARVPINGDPGSAYWNGFVPTDDQYAEVTIGQELDTLAGFGTGPMVRMSTGADTGYWACCNVAAAEEIGLYEVTAGVIGTPLATYNAGAAPTAGDVIRIEAQGTTIRVLVNTVERISVTDATLTSGRVGVRGEADVAYSFINDWGGGDLAAGPTSAPLFRGS